MIPTATPVTGVLRVIRAQGFRQFETQYLGYCWEHKFPSTARTVPRATVFSYIPAANRYASTSRQPVTDARSLITRLKNIFLGTAIAAALGLGYLYITDTRAGAHRWAVVPLLRWIYDDAEEAHEAGTKALKALYEFGLHPRERGPTNNEKALRVEVFGHTLQNPIGTSAGIDKHAEIPSPLLALGPAIVEIGGVTPYPQDGNPKPRVFRLPSQRAFINRYGLNSEGADSMAMRLRQRVREYAYAMGFGIDEIAEQRVLDGEAMVPPGSLVDGKLLAVQVAKNKFTADNDIEAIKDDYVYCVNALARYADIIVVNVSSPNTPGLRDLQKSEPLTNILKAVVSAAKTADRKTKPAVMVKVSPDEDSDEDIAGICDAVKNAGVGGVIVGNSTKRRPDSIPAGYTLSNREATILLEQGGYSGPQLFERTVNLVKKYRKVLDEGLHRHISDQFLPQSAPEKPQPPPQGLLSKDQSPNSLADSTTMEKIEGTVQRDLNHLKPPTPEREAASSAQPLLRLPERNGPPSSALYKSSSGDPPALSNSSHINQLPSPEQLHADPPGSVPAQRSGVLSTNTPASSLPYPSKRSPTSASSMSPSSAREAIVIFATGGIANGSQALEVLNAGASVAMVYTALVYGGVGTISRIKDEMVEEMKTKGKRT